MQDYEAFVEKFKPKKTTDDCYTPQPIYEAVKDWAVAEYGLQGRKIVRPFWPGADYAKFDYPENCVVIDNPPFSILSQIVNFYLERAIDFFLFAPALVILGGKQDVNVVIISEDITYENGACVNTGFKTNLGGDCLVRTAPELSARIHELQQNQNPLPKYKYPQNVVTAANINYLCKYGIDYRLQKADVAQRIRRLDSQITAKKSIFGGGLLISEKAAAEKAAAEKAAAEKAAAEKAAAEKAAAEKAAAIEWPLSERELDIIAALNK